MNVRNRVDAALHDELKNVSASLPEAPTSKELLESFLDLPLLETMNRIQAQVGTLQKQMDRVESHVSAAMKPVMQESADDAGEESRAEPSSEQETFLTAVNVQGKESERKAQPAAINVKQEDVEVKNVHLLEYPGFRARAVELPGKLSANDLIKRLSDSCKFAKVSDQNIWEEVLASVEAQDSVKDLFWWFVGDKYHRGRQEEQDKMFARMARNFVRIFTKVPSSSKDVFFDKFHNVISKSVFVAFKVAFPLSEQEFDDNFLGEIARLYAYWSTGADIGPASYLSPNGEVMKTSSGMEEVKGVVGELKKEQEELEQITAEKKKGKHAPLSRKISGEGGRNTSRGRAEDRQPSPRKSPKKGNSDSPPLSSRPTQSLASEQQEIKIFGSAKSSEAKLPSIPPLRLPVQNEAALKTPRFISSARETQRSRATTERVHHTSQSARGVCFLPPYASFPYPPLPPQQPKPPMSARPSSMSSRSQGRDLKFQHLTAQAMKKRESSFNLNENSPFLKFYFLTEVSSALSRPTWKKILSSDVVQAWERTSEDVERLAYKRAKSEGEGGGLESPVASLSIRRASEISVRKSKQMLREYKKKTSMRTKLISDEKRKFFDFSLQQRASMHDILKSQEVSHVFSNLLVSSGGGQAFDSAWQRTSTMRTGKLGK